MSNNNYTIVLLGATGDLSRKKIFPALYHLFNKKRLDNTIIIGVALDTFSRDEFLARIKEFVRPEDNAVWDAFAALISYIPLNFTVTSDFKKLADFINKQEQGYKAKESNRIVYCAAAPFFYCAITQGLANAGIVRKGQENFLIPLSKLNVSVDTWDERFFDKLKMSQKNFHDEPLEVRTPSSDRIVYEKPFGHDLQSAHEINACIASHFNEQQIFRVDHYLTKELVSNIALVRFTNIIFEPLWNNRYIDEVQIIFDEESGMDGRGAYYDNYGALGDVVQNHMMQLLALIGMEAPAKLTGDLIRSERAKVLQKVTVHDAVLGQYKGYTQESGVKQNSVTETFAQILLYINNPRWTGVPFYLKAGKELDRKETTILIKFKRVDCLLSRACPSEPNNLAIQISPKPFFSLSLNVKKPGRSDEVMPVQMHFSHGNFWQEAPQAYEVIFQEILRGEESISVRFDEIEYAWKIIDAVRTLRPPLLLYEKGSKGPIEAEKLFDAKHGIRWKL